MNVQFEIIVHDKLSSLQVLFSLFLFFFFFFLLFVLQKCILCVCVSAQVFVSVYVYTLSFFFCFVFLLNNSYIHKLATLVKASFSIATTPRCKGERYSIPGIAPLYP